MSVYINTETVTKTDRFGRSREIPTCLAGLFGLKGFPGKRFQLNLEMSYNDQLVVSIVTISRFGFECTVRDFSRGTMGEILAQYAPL